ncbi:GvpL/GvpF family gas vesicle protein [Streptomyces sp. NK08204]|uniref:GvpL/GvpF family gas vesicle protein n=1 Tax=Streptomyces sp. NK08204 TaxID=2873260 RepID=UPI001CECF177|nr:GvpL/GvpF family gas vesicle protein [Streptomyces sp. NK08204]
MSVYVYAITRESHPLDVDGLKGVGESPSELRVVRGDSLCAVVSEAPDDLAVKRRDLQAHFDVLDHLWGDGTVLPLSFGFVAQDDDAVRTVLESRAQEFSQRLEELTGRAEFNVKGVQEEDMALRAILETSEQARALNDAIRGGGGTYEDKLALGQLIAQELPARQEALAAEVLDALRPLALSEKLAQPSKQYFVNVSFLVDGERSEEFARTVQEVEQRCGDGVELRLRGPLPPYSFT